MHLLKIPPPPSMNCSHSLNIKVKICQNGLLEECARCTQILKVGLILQRQSITLVFYQLAEELANFCGTSVLRYKQVVLWCYTVRTIAVIPVHTFDCNCRFTLACCALQGTMAMAPVVLPRTCGPSWTSFHPRVTPSKTSASAPTSRSLYC